MTRALIVERLTWRALVAGLMAMAVWLVLALPGLTQPAFPELTGRVVDGANLLSPAREAELEARLAALERDTSDQLVVVTVRTLDGYDIADYGTRLGRHWQIGQEGGDNGVLLIVALEERKIRIEVGYGSTPTLTDAMSGRIIRDTITPAFKEGDFSAGIAAGVDRMIEAMDMDPATAKAIAEAEAAARADRKGERTAATFGGAAVWILLIFAFMFIFGRGKKGRRRRRYGAGSAVGDVLLWTAINSALNSGDHGGGGWGGGGGGGGGGFGGFGGGMSGGGGASGGW